MVLVMLHIITALNALRVPVFPCHGVTLTLLYIAHDDDIWSVAWSKTDKHDHIVTGSVDDSVKSWFWSVYAAHLLISKSVIENAP